jgi:hypothetical protein
MVSHYNCNVPVKVESFQGIRARRNYYNSFLTTFRRSPTLFPLQPVSSQWASQPVDSKSSQQAATRPAAAQAVSFIRFGHLFEPHLGFSLRSPSLQRRTAALSSQDHGNADGESQNLGLHPAEVPPQGSENQGRPAKVRANPSQKGILLQKRRSNVDPSGHSSATKTADQPQTLRLLDRLQGESKTLGERASVEARSQFFEANRS